MKRRTSSDVNHDLKTSNPSSEPESLKYRFNSPENAAQPLGIVLSGGGVRAAYQVGALKAVNQTFPGLLSKTQTVFGSSIGSINGLIFSAGLKHSPDQALEALAEIWRRRTFSNTFGGSPSLTFVRAIRTAISQYLNPGPQCSARSIFDPTPLHREVDNAITELGGLGLEDRSVATVGVMTTVEGQKRSGMLFLSSKTRLSEEQISGASYKLSYVDKLSARHGFGSAALPSVLPAVELETEDGKVKVIDGGISQNVPVDPTVRFGAQRIVLVDISGRSWWHDKYGEPHDHRPSWEVESGSYTFCLRPPEILTVKNPKSLGALLKAATGSSTRRFIQAVGPIWPMFQLVKSKLGEEAAYEVMSYVAMDGEYLNALIETGYHETLRVLRGSG